VKSKSLRALAKEIGVSPAYLCQIKSGKKKPSAKVLTKLLTNVNQDEFDVGVYFSYNLPVAGELCSGSTGDFGSSSPGSNPGSPASKAVAHSSSG
jgi:transcriptional regulator with XRE-family HTH domain